MESCHVGNLITTLMTKEIMPWQFKSLEAVQTVVSLKLMDVYTHLQRVDPITGWLLVTDMINDLQQQKRGSQKLFQFKSWEQCNAFKKSCKS